VRLSLRDTLRLTQGFGKYTGGGFLIVPGLMLGSGMPMLYAVGSSLFSVAAFGFTTAANYAWSGLIDWPVALVFIAGGAAGGLLGIRLATRLSGRRGVFTRIFAALVILVAVYVVVHTLAHWWLPWQSRCSGQCGDGCGNSPFDHGNLDRVVHHET